VIQWLYLGFGLVIGFTEHLQNVATCNCSVIATSHTLQFTTVRTKSSQSAVSSPVVAWWRITTITSAAVLTSLLAADCPTTKSFKSKSKLRVCYDRRSVGQSVLVSSTHLGPKPRFLLLSDRCEFVIWGALSDKRTGLSFTISASTRQHSHIYRL
jgi:hypothetical protein